MNGSAAVFASSSAEKTAFHGCEFLSVGITSEGKEKDTEKGAPVTFHTYRSLDSVSVKTWACPNEAKHQDVRALFGLVARQSAALQAEKEKSCGSTPISSCKKVVVTFLRIITLNGFCGLIPLCKLFCCRASEDERAQEQASDIGFLPAWIFYEHRALTRWTLTSSCFKNMMPWPNSVYARFKDPFTHAREDLFAGRVQVHPNIKKNEQVSITAPDGVVLDGIFFEGSSDKVILFIPGISGTYEESALPFIMRDFITFFHEICPHINILMVNPRGIGLSQSMSTPASLPLDAFCSFQFLISLGFDPEKVLTWGHSLGGGYGLQGAALIQKEYPDKRISAVSDRSFARISDVAEASFCGCCAKGYIERKGLELDCTEAASSLTGQVVSIAARDDGTIPYERASFQTWIDKSRIKNYTQISLEEGIPYAHTRKFSANETDRIGPVIRAILDGNWKAQDRDFTAIDVGVVRFHFSE